MKSTLIVITAFLIGWFGHAGLTSRPTPPAAHTHQFGKWETVNKGIKWSTWTLSEQPILLQQHTCTNCGYSETEWH